MNEDRRFASRKFILTVLALLAGGAFRVLGYIDAPLWVDFTKWTLALYFGANVGTWAVDAFKGKS